MKRLSTSVTIIALCIGLATAWGRTPLPGTVVVPRGTDVRQVINRAVAARGGKAGWEWIRRIAFRQRIQVRSNTGVLLEHGHEFKQLAKHRGNLFARSENLAHNVPPFVRCFGPNGIWLSRAGHQISDRHLADMYLRELTTDFLFLSLPHVLQSRGCDRVYQGIRPVRGVPCHQILVVKLPRWKTFEDHEFLLSVSVDDYRVVALSFWQERKANEKTDVFFDNYRLLTDGSFGHTYWLPQRWEIVEPDGSNVRSVLDAVEVNPRFHRSLFVAPPGKDAGFAADRARNAGHVPSDRLPLKKPRPTLFVRPAAWSYYLRGKRSSALK